MLVLNASFATPTAHWRNFENPSSNSKRFSGNVSERKNTNPTAKASTRETLLKTSSTAFRFRVNTRSWIFEFASGVDCWLLTKIWMKSSFKKSRVWDFSLVKSTGWMIYKSAYHSPTGRMVHTFKIIRLAQSLAIHHAYALATCCKRVFDILFTSNSTSSLAFLITAAPPTLDSPRSRKKSHKANCNVIL